jgi:hypothetical protein
MPSYYRISCCVFVFSSKPPVLTAEKSNKCVVAAEVCDRQLCTLTHASISSPFQTLSHCEFGSHKAVLFSVSIQFAEFWHCWVMITDLEFLLKIASWPKESELGTKRNVVNSYAKFNCSLINDIHFSSQKTMRSNIKQLIAGPFNCELKEEPLREETEVILKVKNCFPQHEHCSCLMFYSSGIQPGLRVPPGVREDILGGT